MNVAVGGVPVVAVVVPSNVTLPAVLSVNTTVTSRGFSVMLPSVSVFPVGDVGVMVAGAVLRPTPSFEATIVTELKPAEFVNVKSPVALVDVLVGVPSITTVALSTAVPAPTTTFPLIVVTFGRIVTSTSMAVTVSSAIGNVSRGSRSR